MTTVLVKLVCFDRIKLLESDSFVKYPEIRSVYDSMVPTPLRVGFSNLFFKNSKDEIFEINDSDSFWAYITLEYPKSKTHISEVPVVVISVVVKNLDYLNSNGLTIHQYIICDSCDRKVAGIRYKCAVCKDYDLCQYCERQNIHDPSHVMLRFARPIDSNSRPYLNVLHQLQTKSDELKNEALTAFDRYFNKISDVEQSSDVKEKSKKEEKEIDQCCDNYLNFHKDMKNKFALYVAQNNLFQGTNKVSAENEFEHNVRQFIGFINVLPYDFLADQGFGKIDFDYYKICPLLMVQICLAKQKYGTINEEYVEKIINNYKSQTSSSSSNNESNTPKTEVSLVPDCPKVNEISKGVPEEEDKMNSSSCFEEVSVIESCTTGSDFDINGDKKISAFELSKNSIVSMGDDDESNVGLEIIDHRSETNTSSSISDWKDNSDEFDYKNLVKQMELQRSGIFEKIIDDIEPDDSASMVGSKNFSADVELSNDTRNSNLSFSIITCNTNETITSKKS